MTNTNNDANECRFGLLLEWIMYDTRLSIQARMLYGVLQRYAKDEQPHVAWPSQARIASHLAHNGRVPNRASIRRWTEELVSAGIISINPGAGRRSTRYTIRYWSHKGRCTYVAGHTRASGSVDRCTVCGRPRATATGAQMQHESESGAENQEKESTLSGEVSDRSPTADDILEHMLQFAQRADQTIDGKCRWKAPSRGAAEALRPLAWSSGANWKQAFWDMFMWARTPTHEYRHQTDDNWRHDFRSMARKAAAVAGDAFADGFAHGDLEEIYMADSEWHQYAKVHIWTRKP